MTQQGLDWNHPDVVKALHWDSVEGFGFQCDYDPSKCSGCLYIGQPFHEAEHNRYTFPSREFHGTDADTCLAALRAALPSTITADDVWITNYLGHNFLTIATRQYPQIPVIINALLTIGYRFLTHSSVKAIFTAGQVFTRNTFEEHILETVNDNYTQLAICMTLTGSKPAAEVWRELMHMSPGWKPLLKPWNWATQRGRDLCAMLRAVLHKKPASDRRSRPCMAITWYTRIANDYGILHAGGWSAYDVKNE